VAAPHRSVRLLLIALVLVAGLVLSRDIWLRAIGSALVTDETAVKAEVAIVLGGDYSGERILRGAELVRQGMAASAWVSGPDRFYGGHESDFAVAYAIRRGYPAAYFVPFPNQTASTVDEAALFVPELDRRGIRSVLLVTSDYHTARAARIFRAEVRRRKSPVQIHVVAVYTPERNAENWWQTREGRKTVFFESAKTVATALGI
jgi:uncharacterized SAM-binding protein YcdF (DUF218 family)